MTGNNVTQLTVDDYNQGMGRDRVIYGFSKTPLGWVMVAWQDGALCYFNFVRKADDVVATTNLQMFWPYNTLFQDDIRAREFVEKIFQGHYVDLSVNQNTPILLKGHPFQLSVWKALLELSDKEMLTYGDMATRIGKQGGAQAVGQALTKNPICLVVPCHRVMGSDGKGGYKMGGYAHGTKLKEKILKYEGVL